MFNNLLNVPYDVLCFSFTFKGFNSELIANWLQNIVINFPFAFFTQLFLIQPFVRFVFRNVFKNQLNNDKCIVNEA